MKMRVLNSFKNIFPTDAVDIRSVQYMSALNQVRAPAKTQAIIIIKGVVRHKGKYFIVDGNHRAVASAVESEPIDTYEIISDHDIENILYLESIDEIAPFPHRQFLMKKKTIAKLRQESATAWESLGSSNIEQLSRELKAKSGKEDVKQPKDLKERILQHRFVPTDSRPRHPQQERPIPAKENIVRRAEILVPKPVPKPKYVVKVIESTKSSNAQSDNAEIKRPELEYDPNLVAEWSTRIRHKFSKRNAHSGFSCTYSEFAKICQQPDSKGKDIADELIQRKDLERVSHVESALDHWMLLTPHHWRLLNHEKEIVSKRASDLPERVAKPKYCWETKQIVTNSYSKIGEVASGQRMKSRDKHGNISSRRFNPEKTPKTTSYSVPTSEWIVKIRSHFGDVRSGDEFPCPYAEFARICEEKKSFGQTIAKYLTDERVIEFLEVRFRETGRVYSTGKPERQKISYWRMLTEPLEISD